MCKNKKRKTTSTSRRHRLHVPTHLSLHRPRQATHTQPACNRACTMTRIPGSPFREELSPGQPSPHHRASGNSAVSDSARHTWRTGVVRADRSAVSKQLRATLRTRAETLLLQHFATRLSHRSPCHNTIEGREIRTPNLLIWSQTRCRCAIPPSVQLSW